MTLNLTTVGILIYATMAVWLVSIVLHAAKAPGRRETFLGGFAIALAAFVVRWFEVSHVPLQSLMEVFLALGVAIWPLWMFCQKFLGARGVVSALVVGVVLLFPAGFVFSSAPQHLPPALQSWLFIPHVTAYMLSYTILVLAAVQSVLQLTGPQDGPDAHLYEQASSSMMKLAFPLLTTGLILGAVWGKLCWGDYWNWDPKELWSLATWLLVAAYLHFRSMYGSRFPKANAICVITVSVCVILTLIWINLGSKIFKGMHMYAD